MNRRTLQQSRRATTRRTRPQVRQHLHRLTGRHLHRLRSRPNCRPLYLHTSRLSFRFHHRATIQPPHRRMNQPTIRRTCPRVGQHLHRRIDPLPLQVIIQPNCRLLYLHTFQLGFLFHHRQTLQPTNRLLRQLIIRRPPLRIDQLPRQVIIRLKSRLLYLHTSRLCFRTHRRPTIQHQLHLSSRLQRSQHTVQHMTPPVHRRGSPVFRRPRRQVTAQQ